MGSISILKTATASERTPWCTSGSSPKRSRRHEGNILRYNELARNQGTNGRVDRGELDIGEVPDGRESNADGDYDRVLNA
ncbi:hypothetical protein JCM9743_31090 [Natrinema sp. JCM 9743]